MSMNGSTRGKPRSPEPPKEGLGSFIARRRAGLGGAAVLMLAVAGAAWLWSAYGPRVRMGPQYALPQESIAVVGIPAWVKTDLKLDVLRAASLDGPLAVDDPDLSRRIARGFAMHPWVKQVVGVELVHPPGARVEILCRQPVAMVKVEGGVLPIDGEGVVLPSDGFTAEDAAAYPKIVGIASSPQGPAGTPWGDEAVDEAGAIAMLVQPERQSLGPLQIRFDAVEGHRRWMLLRPDADGKEGGRIRFGAAPGKERPGEPSAAAKLARLRQLGPSALEPGESLDLTLPEPVPSAPPEAPPSAVPGSGGDPPSGTTRTGSTPTS